MTDEDKAILRRALLAGLKLIRSKKDTTARRYAAEIVNAISELMDERKV